MAEDSESILPAMKGEEVSFTRKGIIHHSISGHFAYREEKWKLLLAYGSAGWTQPNEKAAKQNGLPKAQLYNLDADPSESNNLYGENLDIGKRLLEQLTSYIKNGSSVNGKESKNDTSTIKLWKSEK